MLKEEVLMLAEQNHIQLTESQLRRYIQYGLIITTKISQGKGQGVTTLFPNNTIEIVKEIEKGKSNGFAVRELIYYLFTKGFLVDFKKFKKSLLNDIESMLEGFEVLLEKTQDRLDRKFIIEEIALEKIPKLEPGRPSTNRLVSLDNKKKIEENKIQSILNLIEEIFNTGKVSPETSVREVYNFKLPDDTAVLSDQMVLIGTTQNRAENFFRLLKVIDSKGNELHLITNRFDLSAEEISEMYKSRWAIELFFKWIKQHLSIKKFYGQSEWAIHNQVFIALIVFCLHVLVQIETKSKRKTLQISRYLRAALWKPANIWLQKIEGKAIP